MASSSSSSTRRKVDRILVTILLLFTYSPLTISQQGRENKGNSKVASSNGKVHEFYLPNTNSNPNNPNNNNNNNNNYTDQYIRALLYGQNPQFFGGGPAHLYPNYGNNYFGHDHHQHLPGHSNPLDHHHHQQYLPPIGNLPPQSPFIQGKYPWWQLGVNANAQAGIHVPHQTLPIDLPYPNSVSASTAVAGNVNLGHHHHLPNHHHHLPNHNHHHLPLPNHYNPHYHGHGYPQFAAGYDLTLPRQIKVPARMNINHLGSNVEITCEFPRYLLLVQKIYWHHRNSDPFGSYYDSTNGFGPRITVLHEDQWKSVLVIRDYTEDDYGQYRCISAAILPEDDHLAPGFSRSKLLESGSTTTERIYADDQPYDFDSGNNNVDENSIDNKTKVKSTKSTNKTSRKIRFLRSIGINSKDSRRKDETLLTQASNIVTKKPSSASSTTTVKSNLHNLPRSAELNQINSGESYDPYNYNKVQQEEVTGRYNTNGFYPSPPDHTTNQYFNPLLNHHQPGTSTVNPNNQQSYHSRSFYPHHIGYPNYPNYGWPQQIQQQIPTNYPNYPTSLHAPYYKPHYSVFTVYQDISFGPSFNTRLISTSPNPGK